MTVKIPPGCSPFHFYAKVRVSRGEVIELPIQRRLEGGGHKGGDTPMQVVVTLLPTTAANNAAQTRSSLSPQKTSQGEEQEQEGEEGDLSSEQMMGRQMQAATNPESGACVLCAQVIYLLICLYAYTDL